MGDNDVRIETKKPLTFFEKVGVGIKSFGKAVMDYLPKGLLMSGLMLGAATVVANMGGWDIFGMGGIDAFGFVKRLGLAIGIGSLITGGMAAYQGVKAHTAYRDKEIEIQEAMLAREHARSRGKSRESSDDMPVVASGGLPPHLRNTDLVRGN